MFTFEFDIPLLAIVLFGSALFLILPLVFLYLRPLWRVRNAVKRQEEEWSELRMNIPVSVIVYASNEAESLKRLLPSILGQRYDGEFEVIVVNEGQSDATAEVVERLRLEHDNLYLTYTPDGARQLSRKKLALMIGIKAARYPIVIQTIASASIESDMWLARMTEPFVNPYVEVVLGAEALSSANDSGVGKLNRIFNSATDSIIWLGSALDRRPYRGSELNLAYTRDVFFNNRGFSSSLNLKYGDDDIFVNEVSTRRNTAVVLHPEAMVKRMAWNTPRVYRELRSRYNFTGRNISHLARRMHAFGSWMLWLIILLCIAGGVIMLPNLLGVAIGLFLILVTLILCVILWKKAIFTLTGEKLNLSLLWLIPGRPFANLIVKMKSAKHRKRNYTWIK